MEVQDRIEALRNLTKRNEERYNGPSTSETKVDTPSISEPDSKSITPGWIKNMDVKNVMYAVALVPVLISVAIIFFAKPSMIYQSYVGEDGQVEHKLVYKKGLALFLFLTLGQYLLVYIGANYLNYDLPI